MLSRVRAVLAITVAAIAGLSALSAFRQGWLTPRSTLHMVLAANPSLAPGLGVRIKGSDTLAGSASAWRAVRNRVTRSFAAQDLALIMTPCAPLLLLLGNLLAAIMVAALWHRVAPRS